jgi:23S rRNA (guanine745-N1)-methyltransferase
VNVGDPPVAEPARRLFPAAILRALRCPLCGEEFAQQPSRLVCSGGHSFDRARHGHVTLGLGHKAVRNADSAEMVAARDVLLTTGLYGPIRQGAAELIDAHLPPEAPALVADLAGGTGYYLAGILDRLPPALGICIDLSTAALKKAARSHPRAVAIGADLRGALPLATGSVDVVTSIFGPRPVPEIRRALAPRGVLAVVTPTSRHLAELVGPLGMVTVDRHKEERLATSLDSFTQVARQRVEFAADVTRDQARALVAMGPSAHHVTPDQLGERLGRLGANTPITVSVNIGIYSRSDRPATS